jgi:predicted dienelactone hydrolase
VKSIARWAFSTAAALASAAAACGPGSAQTGSLLGSNDSDASTAGASSNGGSGAGSSGSPGTGTSNGASSSGAGPTGASGSGGPAGSSGGASGSSGASTSSSSTGGGATTTPAEVAGCGTTKLYGVPDDASAAGPWPVGVHTAQLSMTGGMRPVEIWYPATLGSDQGASPATYDVEDYLPNGQASKIPTSANKIVSCGCYRDLPIDGTHGPYPAVIFLHGTGSYRTASLSTMVQWASRGFVVVATDHAGLFLTDFLVTSSLGSCTGGTGVAYGSQNLSADVDAMIAALTNMTGDFGTVLGSHVDMSRIGVSGHSQGAQNAAQFSTKPNVEVDMPLADLGGTVPSATAALKSVVVIGGTSDSVVPFSSDMSAYSGSTAPTKRLVGITNADHLDVTDLCWETNSAGQTAIEAANQYGVCGVGLLDALAKCGTLSPPTLGPAIVNYATTAALEEALHCQDRSAAFSGLQSKFPEVGTYEHTP